MNPFQSAKPAKKATYTNDSILEALRDLSGGVGKTVTKDVAGKVATDALASLFGTPMKPTGEMRPNQAVDLPAEPERQPQLRRPDVAQMTSASREDAQMIGKQIESVRAELKALASSIQSLNTEIKKAVAEVPVDPGIYHVNFFERLRSILQVLREQVDDSRSWLTMSAGRKKKQGYWGMFKKHGTTFGLSNERSIATSAG